MTRTCNSISMALTMGLLAMASPLARAVPYASGIRNTSLANWEFVLNEAADNVTVLRNGGNPLNLGPRAAGRHTFNLETFSTFDIEVSKSAPAGWSLISDPTNLFTNFTIPSGLAINANPASQYFGTVYVASSVTTPTERGRQMGDGIYALTADMKGVDASTFVAITDPNDASQAKAPGFSVDGAGTVSPWRMTLDAAGNLIISDWSDAKGGLKYAAPNLTSGGLVLAGEFGEPGVTVHGSIASKAYVTGSVGNNLTVFAMDEDLSPFNSIWRWDVGNATAYNQPPTTVIDSAALNSLSTWIHSFNGVRAGNHYSPQHDKWYLVQNRDNGNEAGILVVEADDTGFDPTLLWDSLTFTNDPNGDFDPSDALDGATNLDGIQDVFRNIGDVTTSADGTSLLVQRLAARAGNPHEGGAVIIIPLDEDGVPDIDVAGGMMTNIQTITTIGDGLAHSSGAQLEFDAAGNLYVANSGIVAGDPNASAQLVQVYSPGGSTKATTSSNGTFTVAPLAAVNNADFDSDGDVDGADFLTWQRNLGVSGSATRSTGDANNDANVTGADLDVWKAQFGQAPPVGGATAAVPEPTALLGVITALSVVFEVTRRRRRAA